MWLCLGNNSKVSTRTDSQNTAIYIAEETYTGHHPVTLRLLTHPMNLQTPENTPPTLQGPLSSLRIWDPSNKSMSTHLLHAEFLR